MTKVLIKRSSTPGAIPTASQLSLGELAINTWDGKMYLKKNDGSDTVVEVSAGGGNSYTAGFGIDITGQVISSTIKSAGTGFFGVQIGDGIGNFSVVPVGSAGKVLTSNGTDSPTWEVPEVSGGTVTSVTVDGGVTGLSFTGNPITTSGTVTMTGTLSLANGGTGTTSAAGIISTILPSQTGHASASLTTDGAGNLSWAEQPGTIYFAGVGLTLAGTTFNSTVADNAGNAGHIPLTAGDGTLTNMDSGQSGQVLTSGGSGNAPDWADPLGTVSDVQIFTDPEYGLHISGGDAYIPPDPSGARHITRTGSIGLSGTLSVLHGGTGHTTIEDVRVAVYPGQGGSSGQFLTTNGTIASWADPLPDQTGNSGQFLTTNGSVTSWGTPAGAGTVTSVDASVPAFLSISGGPITTFGSLAITLSGSALPVTSGGTGQTSASAAINALVPSQGGNVGKILTTDGSAVSWTTSSAGSVTSIDIDPDTTGLSFSGGPITTDGTFTVGGTLAVTHGGTGQTTALAALNALLPGQSNPGTLNKFLQSNGANTSWVAIPDPGAGTVTSIDVDGGTTGLTFSGGPITTDGTFTVDGTVAILHGGTGATTASAAINALVPAQTSQAGKILTTDGSVVSWTTAAAGSVTSIDASGGTTGLTFSGGPVTSSGTVELTGTLALSNGGTGATSAQTARNNILPTQGGSAGQFLTTDGSNVSWSTVGSAGTVTNFSFNNANGISGVVTNSHTIPDLTLTLGAITPSSVAAVGVNSGSTLSVQTAVNTAKSLAFGVGAPTVASNLRWVMGADGSTESGTAGANFLMSAYDGAGSASTVLTISRASQAVDFKVPPTLNGVALSTGGGTVTAVAVASANGITGTVAGTSTQTITLALGAITPSSVTASGTVQALNVNATGTFLLNGLSGSVNQFLQSNGTGSIPTWVPIPATDANLLTGTTLNSGVVNSSLTSVGTLSALSVAGVITLTNGTGTAGQVLTSNGGVTAPTWQSTGSVTSVSVVSANGVSGTVATSTSTPAITLLLGDITPTSITTAGTVTLSQGAGTLTLSSAGTGVATYTITGAASGGTTAYPAAILIKGGDQTLNASPTAGAVTIAGGNNVSTSTTSGVVNAGGNVNINGGLTPTAVGGQTTIGGDIVMSTAAGGLSTAAGTLVERLRIKNTGEWTLAGTSATAGQVLTVASAGAAPTWQPVTASFAGGTVAGATTFSAVATVTPSVVPTILLSSTSAATIAFASGTAAPPITGSRSLGTKLVLFPEPAGSMEFAMGIDSATFWYSMPLLSTYKWYGGVNATPILQLTSAGVLTLTGSMTSTGPMTLTGAGSAASVSTTTPGQLKINGTISNMIDLSATGVGPPTSNTAGRSIGTKIILYNEYALNGPTDFAIGIDNATMWFGTGGVSDGFNWYTATTSVMALTAATGLTIAKVQALIPATGAGNSLTLTGSNAVTAATVGGAINISGGNGLTTGTGGAANISGGTSPTGTGGAVNISGGTGATTGLINLTGIVNITGTTVPTNVIKSGSGSLLYQPSSGSTAAGLAAIPSGASKVAGVYAISDSTYSVTPATATGPYIGITTSATFVSLLSLGFGGASSATNAVPLGVQVGANFPLTIDTAGNVIIGPSITPLTYVALATTATAGHLYIPAMAGTPTGVPATPPAGRAPIVVDTTNNEMYFYSTGAWRPLIGDRVQAPADTASLSIDARAGLAVNLTLSVAITTLTFANVLTTKQTVLTFYLTQDATGGRTVIWPAGVKFPGGGAPALTTSAGATDIIVLRTPDGVTFYGEVIGMNY